MLRAAAAIAIALVITPAFAEPEFSSVDLTPLPTVPPGSSVVRNFDLADGGLAVSAPGTVQFSVDKLPSGWSISLNTLCPIGAHAIANPNGPGPYRTVGCSVAAGPAFLWPRVWQIRIAVPHGAAASEYDARADFRAPSGLSQISEPILIDVVSPAH